jgi:hypothetical protein
LIWVTWDNKALYPISFTPANDIVDTCGESIPLTFAPKEWACFIGLRAVLRLPFFPRFTVSKCGCIALVVFLAMREMQAG